MNQRKTLAGWLLLAAIVLAVLNMAWPAFPKAVVGASVWLAGLLLWRELRDATRRQVTVLVLIGLAGIGWGLAKGFKPDWNMLLSGNALLLAMLAAVSFMRLIARPETDRDESLPRGPKAVATTLLGVHLFGAVINLSTVFIMADRIGKGRLEPAQIKVLTRGFAAAAFWSPFFAAMAAALTYAPGAKLASLWLMGIPLAGAALVYTLIENRKAPAFTGYPLHPAALALPGFLALAVIVLRYWQPDWPILGIICLLTPTATVLVLLFRKGSASSRLLQHVSETLPGMHNELALFLAAGVMAAGLNSLFGGMGGWMPFTGFGGAEASLTLTFMLLTSIVGVHPVINIAALGTLLAPLHPDGTLLAMTFLAAWGIGVVVSPFSGINLAMQGRYGFGPIDSLKWHGLYGFSMLCVAVVALNLYAMHAAQY